MYSGGKTLAFVVHIRMMPVNIQRGFVTSVGVVNLSSFCTQPQILHKDVNKISSKKVFLDGNHTTSQHLLCLICPLTRNIFLGKTHSHHNAFIQVKKHSTHRMRSISTLELCSHPKHFAGLLLSPLCNYGSVVVPNPQYKAINSQLK